MPPRIATENIYAEDANGVERLVAAAGDPIPDEVVAPTPVVTSPPAAPHVSQLPIADYDSLSDAQVVEQLEGLSPDELEAVRAYEQAHQARGSITRYGLAGSPVDLPRRGRDEGTDLRVVGADEPFEGYDEMTAEDIVSRMRDMSEEQIAAVKAYEADHKQRSTIVKYERPAD